MHGTLHRSPYLEELLRTQGLVPNLAHLPSSAASLVWPANVSFALLITHELFRTDTGRGEDGDGRERPWVNVNSSTLDLQSLYGFSEPDAAAKEKPRARRQEQGERRREGCARRGWRDAPRAARAQAARGEPTGQASRFESIE